MRIKIREVFHIKDLASLFLLLWMTLFYNSAHANGRFPASSNIRPYPNNTQKLLLPATFGLLISQDGGESFHWICEDAIGYGGVYDPDYAINDQGWIYSTTFEGLRRSQDNACTFDNMPFQDPENEGAMLSNIWVSEVDIGSDGKIWASTSTGNKPNGVFVSEDGTNFISAGLYDEITWWRTLKVAPNDPDRVYVSGFIVGQDGNPSLATLHVTEDGGGNWQQLSTTNFDYGVQPNLSIEGVSPTNSDIVYVRSAFAVADVGDILYRSTDGGQTFEEVTRMSSPINAFTVRQNGGVIIGSASPCQDDITDASLRGCVQISSTGAPGTFSKAAEQPAMSCVGERPSDGALFACGNNWGEDNFSLGRSMDDGQTWEPVSVFNDIIGPLECPEETIQHDTCVELWDLTCRAINKCTDNQDAGVGGDGDTSDKPKDDCGACQGGQTTPLAAVLGLFVLLIGFGRRRFRL